LNCRQKKTNQNGYDGNYNQQLNQGKPFSRVVHDGTSKMINKKAKKSYPFIANDYKIKNGIGTISHFYEAAKTLIPEIKSM
jgi:hypothetical protein